MYNCPALLQVREDLKGDYDFAFNRLLKELSEMRSPPSSLSVACQRFLVSAAIRENRDPVEAVVATPVSALRFRVADILTRKEAAIRDRADSISAGLSHADYNKVAKRLYIEEKQALHALLIQSVERELSQVPCGAGYE